MWLLGFVGLGILLTLLHYIPTVVLHRCLALCAAGGIVLVFVRYFLALGANFFWGEGAADEVRGPEPAYYSYFCDKAWRDYKRIVSTAVRGIAHDVSFGIGLGRVLLQPVSWFLALTVWFLLLLMVLPALATAAVLGGIHLAVTAVASGLVFASGFVLWFAEATWRRIRRIEGRCDNCHQHFSLPVYICECGARHKRLVPGPYGPLLRRCRCGRELNALLQLGRNHLHAVCPGCGQMLHSSTLMMRDLFVPIVGGVSSGKSSVMLASLIEFQNNRSGLTVSFPVARGQASSGDRQRFESARADYLNGRPPSKTTDQQVHAIQVCLEDKRAHQRLLYLYDAAGEIFRGDHRLGGFTYYKHIHGLVFVIDPLPLMRRANATSSIDAPEDIYDHVIRTLIAYSGRRGIRNIPMAILVTKCDDPELLDQIFGQDARMAPGRQRSSSEHDRSLKVRSWLLTGTSASVVRTAENYFRNVRYFACSALGRTPSVSGAPFQAHGLLELWGWLLKDCGLIVQAGTQGGGA